MREPQEGEIWADSNQNEVRIINDTENFVEYEYLNDEEEYSAEIGDFVNDFNRL